MVSLTYAKRLEAAERYAAADKSDPFVRARVMTHMNNRVCGFTQNGQDAFYSADATTETRLLPNDGRPSNEREYQATVYVNRQRP